MNFPPNYSLPDLRKGGLRRPQVRVVQEAPEARVRAGHVLRTQVLAEVLHAVVRKQRLRRGRGLLSGAFLQVRVQLIPPSCSPDNVC